MHRSVILALSVTLFVLVFAPITAAQANYRGSAIKECIREEWVQEGWTTREWMPT
jgi:hypothetical protein